jgi:hypothetical protein
MQVTPMEEEVVYAYYNDGYALVGLVQLKAEASSKREVVQLLALQSVNLRKEASSQHNRKTNLITLFIFKEIYIKWR